MGERTDEQLLQQARAGDKAALEELLLRHQERIYRFGMKFCRDPDDAEDIVQETLVAMARSVDDFEGRSSLSTWLYTVARNFCIKKRRKSKFAPDHIASLDSAPQARAVVDPSPAPDESVVGREVEAALEVAIRSLPVDQREVLVLRDMEGLLGKEVADVLGITVAAMKSRLHRARATIREHMEPVLTGEDVALKPTSACPDIVSMYSQYLDDEISSDMCAVMERHVKSCPRCKGVCDSLKKTLAVCRQAPKAQVPEHVQRAVRKALDSVLSDNP